MTKLHALTDRIIAIKHKPDTEETGGLYVPESAKTPSNLATVVSIGEDVTGISRLDNSLEVIFDSESAKYASVGGVEYVILKVEDILALVKEK